MKTPSKRIRFPLRVKRGSSTVKIYRDRRGGGTYYRVVYHLGGKRYRLHFNSLQVATNEAEAKAAQLSRGDLDAAQMTGRDRLVYGRALEAIRDHALPLDAAAIEYAEARKILGPLPLLDAARFYVKARGGGLKRKPVREAANDFIEAKKAQGASVSYLDDLRYRLRVFSNRFACDLVSLTPDDVRDFFTDLKLSAGSHTNFMRVLQTFFNFAVSRGWLSKEVGLLQSTHKRKEKKSPVEIFSPSELRALLEAATPDLAVCLALGAFAGLRSEEVLRLDYSDLSRRPGFVEIAADKAKTQARRLVPISDALLKWLAAAPHRAEGRIWPLSKGRFFTQRVELSRQAGVPWKQNALRHSFISYRLAGIQDVNRVALEAGNSPQMIFRHYRELATPEQARSWFAVAPGEAVNVVPMRTLSLTTHS